MKLPNGYGSVTKLSGKRRKPWVARVVVDYKTNEEKKSVYPVYKAIGYYEKKAEALQGLAEFNMNPYNVSEGDITVQTCYDLWSTEHYKSIKSTYHYEAGYKVLHPIKDFAIKDIKASHIQKCFDESGKNSPTLVNAKIVMTFLLKFAATKEVIPVSKLSIMDLVVIKAGNPNTIDRSVFMENDINRLWKIKTDTAKITLMLIYTGCRISELLALTKLNIHLDKKYFNVTDSKTRSGIREVPIADKMLPLFKEFLSRGGEKLIVDKDKDPYLYATFINKFFKPLMQEMEISHLPHDARHTCISLLVSAGVDKRIIQQIVGHKGEDVEDKVYTHISIKDKLTAINKI